MADTPKPSRLSKLRPTLRDGIVGVLVLVVAVPATLIFHVHVHPTDFPPGLGPILSGIGHLLTGSAALCAFFATLYGAKFARDTYVRWEERHLRERQFELGAATLASALLVCAQLDRIARGEDEANAPQPRTDVDRYGHWDAILLTGKCWAAFTETRTQAEVYFPESVMTPCHDLARQIHAVHDAILTARRRAKVTSNRLALASKDVLAPVYELSTFLVETRAALKREFQPYVFFKAHEKEKADAERAANPDTDQNSP